MLTASCFCGVALAQDAPAARKVTLGAPQLQADGSLLTAVQIDDATDLLAADIDLRFDAARTPIVQVRAGELIRGFFLLSNTIGDTVRVSFAGGSAASGQGTLFEIVTQGPALPTFAFVQVSLNGDLIPADFDRPTVVQGRRQSAGHAGPLGAHPNPFNGGTVVAFDLAQPALVQLEVFNLLGQRIRMLADGGYPRGAHQVLWNGNDAAGAGVGSGTYLVRLRYGERQATTRLTLLR